MKKELKNGLLICVITVFFMIALVLGFFNHKAFTADAAPLPPQEYSVTGIKLNIDNASLDANETIKLEAAVFPANAGNKNIIYSSSKPEVAEVSFEGIVKAKEKGIAMITAETKDGGFKALCTVVVELDKMQPFDISSIMLSDSKQTINASALAGSNILTVNCINDFKVGHGIAIEKAERVSDNQDGTPRYTWFAAQIEEIYENTIKINRNLTVAVDNAVVKHDNFFPFKELNRPCWKNDVKIVIPKGDYEINAVRVLSVLDVVGKDAYDQGSYEVLASNEEDVPDNSEFFGVMTTNDTLLYFEAQHNVIVDFSGSTIKFNGDFHRNEDLRVPNYNENGKLEGYLYRSRTEPINFMNIKNCTNVKVCNVTADGGMNEATKSENTHESADTGYGIHMTAITDSVFENLNLSHFEPDGMLIMDHSHSDTLTNIHNWKEARNITLRNIILDNNARQALSVGTAKNLWIENCRFTNTAKIDNYGGHRMMAGIDFELWGNSPSKSIEDLTIKDCFFDNNAANIIFSNYIEVDDKDKVHKFNNIVIENCVFLNPATIDDDYITQIVIAGNVKGLGNILVRECIFSSTKANYMWLHPTINGQATPEQMLVKFERCNFIGNLSIIANDNSKYIFDNCNFLIDALPPVNSNHSCWVVGGRFTNCFFYYNGNELGFYLQAMVSDSFFFSSAPSNSIDLGDINYSTLEDATFLSEFEINCSDSSMHTIVSKLKITLKLSEATSDPVYIEERADQALLDGAALRYEQLKASIIAKINAAKNPNQEGEGQTENPNDGGPTGNDNPGNTGNPGNGGSENSNDSGPAGNDGPGNTGNSGNGGSEGDTKFPDDGFNTIYIWLILGAGVCILGVLILIIWKKNTAK